MKKKIKVGIFVDGDFIPSYDGASNRFHYLSRYLALNGIDIVIFHGYREWSDISLIRKEPFKTYIFPIKNYYNNLELIASLIRKESIDIIQFDNLEPILLQGIRLAELSGTKLVSEMLYVVRNLAKRLGADKFRISEIEEMEKEVGKSINHLVCISNQDEPLLKNYMRISSSIISVIPSGVDCKEIKYVGPNIKAKNIIFLGNLYFKPNEDAVRIMRNQIYPELRKSGFSFTITGDCPAHLRKECVASGFKFTGTLADLNNLFKGATFALAPIEEGTGMRIKFLNYLAAGIPILTTNIATAGFEKKQCFFIEDDFSKYAPKIVDLFRNEKKLKSISQEGLHFIKKNYDWNIIARRAIRTYRKILANKTNKTSLPSNKILKNSEPVWLQEAIDKKRFKKIKTDALPKEFSYAVINGNKVKAYTVEKIIAVEGMPGAGKTTFIKEYIRNRKISSLPQLQIKNKKILNANTLETSRSFLKTEAYKTKQINVLGKHSKEVVLDRTFITTLAYCYARSKLNRKPEEYASLLETYNKIKHTITLPTHLVYMDISIKKSIHRRKAFSRDKRYKNWFNPTFLSYLKEFYVIELKKILPLTPLYIDTSNLTPDEVFKNIKKMLCKK
ncbi:MAG: glycosyltransferase family 4 protein [bacterium]